MGKPRFGACQRIGLCDRNVCPFEHVNPPPPNVGGKRRHTASSKTQKSYIMRSTTNSRKEEKREERKEIQELKGDVTEEPEKGEGESYNKEKSKRGIDSKTQKILSRERWKNLQPVYGHKKYNKTGLKNLKNTCYMNAILQCLINSENLTDLLMSPADEEKLLTKQPSRLTKELQYLIMVLRSGEFRSVSPMDFKNALGEVKPAYEENKQEDAHEALLVILEQIENSTNLDKILGGEVRTKTECKQCKEVSTSASVRFSCIHLELPTEKDQTTLKECIKSHTKEQILTDKGCNTCKNKGIVTAEAIQKTEISKMSEVLIIQLKRFCKEGKWQKKKYNVVDFPLILDMSPYSGGTQPHEYELFGVVNHHGGLASGHYTALCRDTTETKSWVSHDDQWTSEKIEESKISKKEAYILFYKRKEEEIAVQEESSSINNNKDKEECKEKEAKGLVKVKETSDEKEREGEE